MNERETRRAEIESRDSALIDVHTHSGFEMYNLVHRRYPTSQNVVDLESKTRLSGIDYVVVFPFPGQQFYRKPPEDLSKSSDLSQGTEESPYYLANRQLLYEISMFGNDRFLPFANIFPGVEESLQARNLEEPIRDGKLYGFKLHTLATQTSADKLGNSVFLDLARSYSLPILIHSGPDTLSDPMNIIDLAGQNPDIRFCIAHAARFEKRIYDYLKDNPNENLFIDSSPFLSICKLTLQDIEDGANGEKLDLAYDSPGQALQDLFGMLPDNLIWGSDEPWTTITDDRNSGILSPHNYQDEVSLLKSLPAGVISQIAHHNTSNYLFGTNSR